MSSTNPEYMEHAEDCSYRSGLVFIQNRTAGTIRETESGYEFSYQNDYLGSGAALPVSLTLPLRSEPYESPTLFSFFDGLIPEGWLLNIVSRNWKIDPRDRFGLLLCACRDCIGDVQIEPATLSSGSAEKHDGGELL